MAQPQRKMLLVKRNSKRLVVCKRQDIISAGNAFYFFCWLTANVKPHSFPVGIIQVYKQLQIPILPSQKLRCSFPQPKPEPNSKHMFVLTFFRAGASTPTQNFKQKTTLLEVGVTAQKKQSVYSPTRQQLQGPRP